MDMADVPGRVGVPSPIQLSLGRALAFGNREKHTMGRLNDFLSRVGEQLRPNFRANTKTVQGLRANLSREDVHQAAHAAEEAVETALTRAVPGSPLAMATQGAPRDHTVHTPDHFPGQVEGGLPPGTRYGVPRGPLPGTISGIE
jgi:hypothetical protein